MSAHKPVTTFAFDSRLPVNPNTPDDDPAHPKNVTKGAIMIENQANADTKYDIYPPPRVEGFAAETLQSSYILIGLIAIILIGLACAITCKNYALKIGSSIAVVYAIHGLVGRV
jgi:hypothetical protein